ncbi:PepSY domain-containing protein, partial [Burkholderia thailandensis]|uniref:PepSY-associated TM helix domain-containing protein n=1 Tax=Burkholderia thailandensis TaxID=57975 RepID=UPI00217D6101
MSTTVERALSPAHSAHAGYRTLWRWHFYAGLFVMPFIVILAITGTLYCFQPQIEPLLYPHRLVVEPRATPRLDPDALLASARTAMPAGATPVSVQVSTAPDRSAEYVFRLRDGSRESVYVNPYDGSVLGTLSVQHRFMQVQSLNH